MRITSSSSSPQSTTTTRRYDTSWNIKLHSTTWNISRNDPELAGLGNDPKAAEEIVPEETPQGKAPEELALEKLELLIPPDEDALPDERIPGGAPGGKGGIDMIRNLTL